MPGLADLLVLMHDARGRDSTVRATVREWRHTARMAEAFGRNGDVVMYAASDEPAPETSETISRLWLARPDLVREEHDDGYGRVAVARGDRWWRYDDVNGAISNADDPDMDGGVGEGFGWMLESARVLGALEFADVETGEQAGRPTIRARAVPRPPLRGPEIALFLLGASDADDVVLDVDAERGILLRVELRIGGEPYFVREVREIAFGEAFPDATFELELPAGESARPWSNPVEHHVTLERAVELAPFTVWIVPRVPRDWEVDIDVVDAIERPPTEPQVFIHYRAEHGIQGFTVSQSAVGGPAREELPGGEWQAVRRDGREMELREPVEDWHPAQVRLELGGTRIHLHSDSVSLATLADAAAGLIDVG